jgi:phosphate transport system permease protein
MSSSDAIRVSPSLRQGKHPFEPQQGIWEARRRFANVLSVILATLFALLAVSFLVYLIVYVAVQGSRFLTLNFFTLPPAPEGETGGGIAPAIQGTLILLGLASIVGIPLGMFTGIYLSEFGRGAFADAVRFLVDTLTGIPTIIFGLFAWIIIVVPTHSFSAIAGGAALGIIMIPTMARTTEEVLRLVPRELREASIALGATESRTIVRVVLPAAGSGVITGVVLALARVAGETAPLLMTAFGSAYFNYNIRQPIDALPLRVFNFILSPYQVEINEAYAGSFVLMLLVILASLAIRWATGGFKRSR